MYHHEDGEGVHVRSAASSLHQTETERRETTGLEDSNDSSSEEVDLSEKNQDRTSTESGEFTVQEIRGGIPNEHDVEAPPPPLEKKKSSRSIKDPNLVCIIQA